MAHKLSYRLFPLFKTSLLSCRQTRISTVKLTIKVLHDNLHPRVQEKRAWVVGEQNGQTKDFRGLGSKGEKRDTIIPDHEMLSWGRGRTSDMKQTCSKRHVLSRVPQCLSGQHEDTKSSWLCDVEDERIIFSCWYGSDTCHELVLCWPQSEMGSVI